MSDTVGNTVGNMLLGWTIGMGLFLLACWVKYTLHRRKWRRLDAEKALRTPPAPSSSARDWMLANVALPRCDIMATLKAAPHTPGELDDGC